MQLPDWAVAFVVFLFGVVIVLTYVLDQIPKLSSKAVKAIKSLRAVRDELSGQPPKELDGQRPHCVTPRPPLAVGEGEAGRAERVHGASSSATSTSSQGGTPEPDTGQ